MDPVTSDKYPSAYTQVPNEVVEAMPDMAQDEIRIVLLVCRHTLARFKREVQLTAGEIQELTGLSRRGVKTGVLRAIERGFLTRRETERTGEEMSYAYRLPIEGY